MQYFIKTFEQSIKERWNQPALDEFRTSSMTYGELAQKIVSNHLMFEAAGLKRGDKISINAKSSVQWAEIFMSAVSGGYVAVQLFNGYTPTDTQALVHHSDSRLLFTEKAIFAKMDFEAMPQILAAIDLKSGEILASRGDFAEIYASKEALFAEKYKNGFSAADVNFIDRDLDEVCGINYTSGSTGNPKGVVLTVRNFSANVELIPAIFPYKAGESYVSVLPYAHIFGLTFDMITPLCLGMTLCVLYVPPVPANLKPAMQKYKPAVFFAVPLILTKMIENAIGEFIHSKSGQEKLNDYDNNPDFCNALRIILMEALGGNVKVFVTGGAAIPAHLEELIALKLKAPFVTGYGMTECAPTITLGRIGHYKLKSCGVPVTPWIELKVESQDPRNIPGEVLVKGDVVFTGYYKADETTKAVMTEDGWFKTGDIGVIDEDNVLFLMGRSKNMLLSTNGQNVFPEEIEVVLNALPYVAESLIVERDGHFVAIVVPNQDLAANDNLSAQALKSIMDANIKVLNEKIPGYSQVSGYELRFEPFAKTPKGSIKRFMYA
ncbi:MAG: AMP-binding protein [Bacteroidales bacterium]|nr:AMP-binding protein [Candidatus Cryptobacteroides faecihippi]